MDIGIGYFHNFTIPQFGWDFIEDYRVLVESPGADRRPGNTATRTTAQNQNNTRICSRLRRSREVSTAGANKSVCYEEMPDVREASGESGLGAYRKAARFP